MDLSELVTLVIPARGRPELTHRLLRSLADTRADYEVILVDDASDPPLEEVAAGYDTLRLRCLRCPTNVGPAAARNLGLWQARTPLVAFTDNDVAVAEGWMRALAEHMLAAPPDVAGAGGRVVHEGAGLVGEYATRLRLLDPFEHQGRVLYLVTANCIFRREALLDVGGFDASFREPGGEDPEASFRLIKAGHRLEFVTEAVVRHAYDPSPIGFAKMFYRYGRGCRRAMEGLRAGPGHHPTQ